MTASTRDGQPDTKRLARASVAAASNRERDPPKAKDLTGPSSRRPPNPLTGNDGALPP